MSWKRGDNSAPEKLLSPIGAVVIGDTAYFRNFRTPTVYLYNRLKQKWGRLPDCLVEHTSLAVLPVTDKGAVQFRLHTVGGRNPILDQEEHHEAEFTGVLYQLHSFRDDGPKAWQPAIADYPDMGIKRSQVTVVYSNGFVIAAGGYGDRGAVDKVEVLNTSSRNKEWFEVASLPLKVFRASQCICDGLLYILGGDVLDANCGFGATKSASVVSIESLVTSHPGDNVFTSIDDLRFNESAFVSFHNHVVQIGGWRLDRIANQPLGTDRVHVYSKESESWVRLSECLNMPRCQCFAVAFEDQIMTVGGYTKPNDIMLCCFVRCLQ